MKKKVWMFFFLNLKKNVEKKYLKKKNILKTEIRKKNCEKTEFWNAENPPELGLIGSKGGGQAFSMLPSWKRSKTPTKPVCLLKTLTP